jgi:hypothetical protein
MTSSLPPVSSSWQQSPWDSWPSIFLTEHLQSLSLHNILSDERMDLSFTIAAGPSQHSHFQVWVQQDLWPHFTVFNSRLPQPGGPGHSIYIPEEQGASLYPQALGSLFIASYSQGHGGGIRPHLHTGISATQGSWPSLYNVGTGCIENSVLHWCVSICCLETCFTALMPRNGRIFCSIAPAFRCHVTIRRQVFVPHLCECYVQL